MPLRDRAPLVVRAAPAFWNLVWESHVQEEQHRARKSSVFVKLSFLTSFTMIYIVEDRKKNFLHGGG